MAAIARIFFMFLLLKRNIGDQWIAHNFRSLHSACKSDRVSSAAVRLPRGPGLDLSPRYHSQVHESTVRRVNVLSYLSDLLGSIVKELSVFNPILTDSSIHLLLPGKPLFYN